MPGLFLDTAGWYAALSPRESGHELARRTYAEAARRGIRLVTTLFVIAETQSLLLRSRGSRAGHHFLEHALESDAHHVVETNRSFLMEAVARWIARYADQRFSLCDAVSFEVMRRERISHAITYDRHFRAAGFRILGSS